MCSASEPERSAMPVSGAVKLESEADVMTGVKGLGSEGVGSRGDEKGGKKDEKGGKKDWPDDRWFVRRKREGEAWGGDGKAYGEDAKDVLSYLPGESAWAQVASLLMVQQPAKVRVWCVWVMEDYLISLSLSLSFSLSLCLSLSLSLYIWR